MIKELFNNLPDSLKETVHENLKKQNITPEIIAGTGDFEDLEIDKATSIIFNASFSKLGYNTLRIAQLKETIATLEKENEKILTALNQ